jgi:hypothetical protein
MLALWRALTAGDLNAAVKLVHPDFVEEYPQSGERIRGVANMRAMVENYPGLGTAEEPFVQTSDAETWAVTPAYTVVRIEDNANKGTAVLKVRYGDGSEWWMVALFELKDGLLFRQTSYFAEPFEAPEWRAPWVERY